MTGDHSTATERRVHGRAGGARGILVDMGGATCVAVNWSLGGVLLDGAAFTIGALVDVTGLGATESDMRDVLIRARVQRVEDDGKVALAFHDLDNRGFEAMRDLMERQGG